MKLLDLFSGIGGFSLAAHWLGWETVAFCEQDQFCQKVLVKNFPGVPIHDDVKKIEEFDQYVGTIDIISGGYPCQPFSVAGKQRGADDDRHLWPAMFEIIKRVRPRWVVAENVAGHVKMGLDNVLSDLESEGYTARAVVIPACAVNAKHRRDRVWIIANIVSKRLEVQSINEINGKTQAGEGRERTVTRETDAAGETGQVESILCGSLYGIPATLDRDIKIPNYRNRIQALGNAIVPQVVYRIFI